MSRSFPRISFIIDFERESHSQSELNALAVGFGLHQAWMLSTMFGSSTMFGVPTLGNIVGDQTIPITLVFIISSLAATLTLFFAAVTDQRYLHIYTAKGMIIGSGIITFIGSLIVLYIGLLGLSAFWISLLAGITIGIGSGFLLMLWGVAYSRYDSPSIVLNTVVAMGIALSIYSFLLHVIPHPFSGFVVTLLPLLQLPLLWQLTPISYAVRLVIPIFNPLPIHKGLFSLRLALPVLLFGFALGIVRSVSTWMILPSSDMALQLMVLMSGGLATVLLLIASFFIDQKSHWDGLFRPTIPIIIISLLFLPTIYTNSPVAGSFILLTCYLCFEALMWIFFSEISQEFRLSPIYIFGVGRGCIALSALIGSMFSSGLMEFRLAPDMNGTSGVVIIMLLMMGAYMLLPRVRDIKQVVKMNPPEFSKTIDSLNQKSRERILESKQKRVKELFDIDFSDDMMPSIPFNRVKNKIVLEKSDQSDVARTSPENSKKIDDFTNEDSKLSIGWFKAQCERVADRYLLTRRETEVMYLLAKGYNAAYLQEKLYISKSTAKTHISNIYKKLDIHSQQELIALIEEGKESKTP